MPLGRVMVTSTNSPQLFPLSAYYPRLTTLSLLLGRVALIFPFVSIAPFCYHVPMERPGQNNFLPSYIPVSRVFLSSS
jgi:hypothetical protein